MSESAIIDQYYMDLQISRLVSVFISSFSLLFISFIIGKWANVWGFWAGGYKIRVFGNCVDHYGEGTAQTLMVRKNGGCAEFHHIQLNPPDGMHEIIVEQSTQDYLEQKWYKFHHLHVFASLCLFIAYILSFIAVNIGVIDDKSTVHTRIFVAIVVFKKTSQIIIILLCSLRNTEVRGGVKEIFKQRRTPDDREKKIGGFCFIVLLLITVGLSIFEIYSVWSCYALMDWDSRRYNESECASQFHNSAIANAFVTAVTVIIVDKLFLSSIDSAALGAYERRWIAYLNASAAVFAIVSLTVAIFLPNYIIFFYTEILYIAFLQYTTYMLSLSGD